MRHLNSLRNLLIKLNQPISSFGIFLVPFLVLNFFYVLNKYRDGNMATFGSFKTHLLMSLVVFGCFLGAAFLLGISKKSADKHIERYFKWGSILVFGLVSVFSIRVLYRDGFLGGLTEGFWVGSGFIVIGSAVCLVVRKFLHIGYTLLFSGIFAYGFGARLFSILHFKFAEQSDILFKIRNAIVYWMYIDGKPYDHREMFQNPERIYHAIPDMLPGTWLAYVPSNWMAFDYRYWSLVMASGIMVIAAFFAKEWFDKNQKIDSRHWLLLAGLSPYWLNPYLATRMDHDFIWLAFASTFLMFAVYIQKWFWVFIAAVLLLMSSYLAWALVPFFLVYCIHKKGSLKSMAIFLAIIGTAFYYTREFFLLDPDKFMEATWQKYIGFTELTYSWAMHTMMNFNFTTLLIRMAKQELLFGVQVFFIAVGFLGFFLTKSFRSLHLTSIWAIGTTFAVMYASPLVWSYMLILVVPVLIFAFADTSNLKARVEEKSVQRMGFGISGIALVCAGVLFAYAENPHGEKRPDSRHGLLDLGYAGAKVRLERVNGEPLTCNENNEIPVRFRVVNDSKFRLPSETKFPLVLETQPLDVGLKGRKIVVEREIQPKSSVELDAVLGCKNPGEVQKYSIRIVQPDIAEGHNEAFQKFHF